MVDFRLNCCWFQWNQEAGSRALVRQTAELGAAVAMLCNDKPDAVLSWWYKHQSKVRAHDENMNSTGPNQGHDDGMIMS